MLVQTKIKTSSRQLVKVSLRTSCVLRTKQERQTEYVIEIRRDVKKRRGFNFQQFRVNVATSIILLCLFFLFEGNSLIVLKFIRTISTIKLLMILIPFSNIQFQAKCSWRNLTPVSQLYHGRKKVELNNFQIHRNKLFTQLQTPASWMSSLSQHRAQPKA